MRSWSGFKRLAIACAAVAMLASGLRVEAQPKEQFIPVLVYRTGP